MSFVSFAQNFEDVVLWRALHEVERGRYLDIGAQDPNFDSVSLAFYKAGWRGLHVEPTPFYAAQLREARPDETVVEAVVTDASGPFPFFEIPQTGISTGRPDIAEHHSERGYSSRQIFVPTVRLDNLFGIAGGDLHWMKIDVEGMEADVLRSWGDSAVRPWIVVIEATFPSTQEQTQHLWIEEVLKRGYQQVLFDGLSCYFLHEDHQELAGRFAAPANVFDGFRVSRQHFAAEELRKEMEGVEQELSEERTTSATIKAQLNEITQSRDLGQQEQKRTLEAMAAAEQTHRDREAQLSTELGHARDEQKRTLDVLTATQTEHRNREAQLVAELGQTREAWNRVQQELKQALERRIAAEQDYRTALAAEAHERQLVEKAHDARQEALLQQLSEKEAAAAASSAEVARLEQWTVGLQTRLDESTEESGVLSTRLAQSEQAAWELRFEIERLKTTMAHAQTLICHVAARPTSRWVRFGEALGFRRSPDAVGVLAKLLDPHKSSDKPPQTFTEAETAGTPSIMQLPMPTNAGNPYLRADSLPELLAWHDMDFVRCAFVTILGRQPDAGGEAYYLNRVRAGHSKLEVLWQLRRSSEGRRHDPGIAGLDRALKRAALGRKPIIGDLVRLFTKTEADDVGSRRWRSLSNSIEYLRVTQERQFALLNRRLESVSTSSPSHQPKEESSTRARPRVALSDRARDIFAAMADVR